MKVDYWTLIGLAPAGGADAIMNAVSILSVTILDKPEFNIYSEHDVALLAVQLPTC